MAFLALAFMMLPSPVVAVASQPRLRQVNPNKSPANVGKRKHRLQGTLLFTGEGKTGSLNNSNGKPQFGAVLETSKRKLQEPKPYAAWTTRPPTKAPSLQPTSQPTTLSPSEIPSEVPSPSPTKIPTMTPTGQPTPKPTSEPTLAPSVQTVDPTVAMSQSPSGKPVVPPTLTFPPTRRPTKEPTPVPTVVTSSPTFAPSKEPLTLPPTTPSSPMLAPSESPTEKPSSSPTVRPSSSHRPFASRLTRQPLPTQPPQSPTEQPSTTVIDEVSVVLSASSSATDDPSVNPPTMSPTTDKWELDANSQLVDSNESPISLTDLQNMSQALIQLQFSIWFPYHRVADLDVVSVENGVIQSLEILFCALRSQVTRNVESSDSLCVLREIFWKNNDDIENDASNNSSSAQVGNSNDSKETNSLQTRQQDDEVFATTKNDYATCLWAPYVSHLEERFIANGGRYSWTTWKVLWEVQQIGRPILEDVIAQEMASKANEILVADDVVMAAINRIEYVMERGLHDSIRSGGFDSMLEAALTNITAQSSPLGDELESFDFTSSNSVTMQGEHGTEDATESNFNSNDTERIVIVSLISASAFVIIITAAIFVLKPRSPSSRTDWKRDKDKEIVGAIHEADQAESNFPSTVAQRHENATIPKQVDLMDRTRLPLPSSIDLQNGGDQPSAITAMTFSKTVPKTLTSSKIEDIDKVAASLSVDQKSGVSNDHLWSCKNSDDLRSAISSDDWGRWSEDGYDAPWRPWPSKKDPSLELKL